MTKLRAVLAASGDAEVTEEARFLLGSALADLGRHDAALADYDRACAQVSSLTVENAELKARIAALSH